MFINKINEVSSNLGFKSYNHVYNNYGEMVMRFNYPYDYSKDGETCEVQIFKVQKTDKLNYKINETPIATIPLKPEGAEVNLSRIPNLGKNEDFAYKIVRKIGDKIIWQGADTGVKIHKGENGEYEFRIHNDRKDGVERKYNPIDNNGNPIKIKNKDGKEVLKEDSYWYQSSQLAGPEYNDWKYTLVTGNGTTPLIQGPGYLIMPDIFKPGMRYKDFNESGTGEVVYDADYQRKIEKMIKTVSNMYGGSIAGVESALPELSKIGIKQLFTTPIANGDNRTSHGYYSKNIFQIPENMGNSENYDSLMMNEIKNGINHVFDITLTSEGIEGIHVNYARRWGDLAQTSKWLRLDGEKMRYGTVPRNYENLRHRVINAPFKTEIQPDGTNKILVNNDYNPNKETLLQLYDKSQVTDEQLNNLDKEIDAYRELNSGRNLDINTYEDTTISYVLEINPNEYKKNIEKINELIKNGRKIELNSPEGTLIASNMSNFSIGKTSEGYVAWDDNPDLIKLNYAMSPYDEMKLQAITDIKQRQHERELIIRATKETRDMAVQNGIYWCKKTRKAHQQYLLNVLGNAKSAEKINQLVNSGKLPKEFLVTQDRIDNILNGNYIFEPKGILNKDDVTIKALMELPLESLEFGGNTTGVLSTSYFTNRATSDDTIGKSRFELLKAGNPHLVDTYASVYNKVNGMFTGELKNFAYDIIKKVNEKSDEPLLNTDGSYTEYGEYVMNFAGDKIAKYALLKSLSGDKFAFKILPNGTITYDYKNIKEATTLKALEINASNPTEEAALLQKKMQAGLKKLNSSDVNNVAESISALIKGTDKNTFRIEEALYKRSGYGLGIRIDAAKDNMDIDSVRNRYADIDDTWSSFIEFIKQFQQGVKSVNEHSFIAGELTDVADVFKDTYGGPDSCPYNGWTNFGDIKYNGEPDAMTKFFNETGITEAAYSYLFTQMITCFSKDFEKGTDISRYHDDFKHKYDLLINTRSVDYLRNLYTFIGNHDKTRTVHALAVDMGLFHSTLRHDYQNFYINHNERADVIRVLSGAYNMDEVPLELRLNVDNLEYFRTISARAVAQSKLLMDSVGEDLKGIASAEDIKLIREGLIDLANGNYMMDKTSEKMTRINIPEISSIENAVREVAKLSGGQLSESEIQSIINKAKSLNIENYLVRGDFNWETAVDYNGSKQKIGDINKQFLKEIIGTDADAMNYSLYTVQIARMIKEAAKGTACENKVNNALTNFVKTYNRNKISENMNGFKMYEDESIARKKTSYAALDFRTALENAINQAEFKSGRKISNKEEIITTVYNSVTEPAIKKHAMMMSFLSGICGIPTLFAYDEYGVTGYEEKSKNTRVKNRLTAPESEIDRNTNYGKMMLRNKAVTYDALRNKATLKPLQNGAPYSMDIMVKGKNREEILQRIAEINAICDDKNGLNKNGKVYKDLQAEKNYLEFSLAKIAFMLQSDDGDMAISVFNAGGIEHNNRVNYFDKYNKYTKAEKEQFLKDNNIETMNPNNPYIPIQPKTDFDAILMGAGVTIPIGTMFINADARDKTKYIVKKIKDKIGIVREDGKNIIMDGITAKNGTMILRKVAFRGRNNGNVFYNKQYNLTANLYEQPEKTEEGKNLSILSK